MDGRFRLKKVAGGVLHLADVAVRVVPAEIGRIAVSDEVFSWRREVYGSQAVNGGPEDQQLIAASVAGVQYVLDRSYIGAGLVTVLQIQSNLADTRPDAVKFAAAMATSTALGIKLNPAPSLERNGIVFPP